MIPQIMRVFKLKSAHDISLLFTSFLLVGMVSWLIYGITMKLVQLIIWNSIGVLTVSTLLYAKLKYGRSP
jgi:MtN3 and saliva related transmembrane protein